MFEGLAVLVCSIVFIVIVLLLVRKFGHYNLATFIMMGVGVILFLLTPLLIRLFDFDSDIFGALIFVIGFLMWFVGFISRKVKSSKQAR